MAGIRIAASWCSAQNPEQLVEIFMNKYSDFIPGGESFHMEPITGD